jgi:arabinogalactan oligomer/maltooligosaccharide transport system substrate-binding protein
VRNASEAPVYQAGLTMVNQQSDLDPIKLDLLVIPPTDSAMFLLVVADEPTVERRVSLTFTDAGGVRWQRDQYGRLTELKPNLRISASPEVAEVLTQFAADVRAAYAVNVEFDTDGVRYGPHGDQLRARFALGEDGADILAAPHDWVGDLVRRGAVDPVVLSEGHRRAFEDWTLDAMSLGGRLYGIPFALDTMALLRNTDLAPQEPDSFEELIELGAALRETGKVQHILAVTVGDRGDPYAIWPLVSSAGGWLFGRDANGIWDQHIIGVDSAESIAAFERIRSLGDLGSRVLRRGTDDAASAGEFYRCETAFLLATSNQAMTARKKGIRLAVSAIPGFSGGGPATSFISVTGMLIGRRAANKVIAQDLVADYLTRIDVMRAHRMDLGAVTSLRTQASDDQVVEAFAQLCRQGMLMPSFPEMGEVWSLLGDAEIQLIAGAQAAPTARRLATNMAALFR